MIAAVHRPVASRLDMAVFEAKAVAFRTVRAVKEGLAREAVRRHGRREDLRDAPVIARVRSPLWSGPTGEKEYALTAGKIQNLRVALRGIDGVVVPAGAAFSFWKQVGRASRRRGFVEGRELREGCLVKSIGGGLCQLSNALYEAALSARFEIVERHAHSRPRAGLARFAATRRDGVLELCRSALPLAAGLPHRSAARERPSRDRLPGRSRGRRARDSRPRDSRAAFSRERLHHLRPGPLPSQQPGDGRNRDPPSDGVARRRAVARVRGAPRARGDGGRRPLPADATARPRALCLAGRALRHRDDRAVHRAPPRAGAPRGAGAGERAAEPAPRLRPQARRALFGPALASAYACRRFAEPAAASVAHGRARRAQLRRARRALALDRAPGPSRSCARRASGKPDARRFPRARRAGRGGDAGACRRPQALHAAQRDCRVLRQPGGAARLGHAGRDEADRAAGARSSSRPPRSAARAPTSCATRSPASTPSSS
jgi:hypothetical protein